MELVVTSQGIVRCLYGEQIVLSALGTPLIERASRVEPTKEGAWCADLALIGGPTLGPYPTRSDALAAEVAWLRAHWLEASEPEPWL